MATGLWNPVRNAKIPSENYLSAVLRLFRILRIANSFQRQSGYGAEAPLSDIGFTGCASRVSGRPSNVSVTHRQPTRPSD